MYSVPFIWGRRYQSLMAVRKCKHRMSIIVYFLIYTWLVVSQHLSNSTKNKHNRNCSYVWSRHVNTHVFTITCTRTYDENQNFLIYMEIDTVTKSCIKFCNIKFHDNSISISHVVMCTELVPVNLKGEMHRGKCAKKFSPTVYKICAG